MVPRGVMPSISACTVVVGHRVGGYLHECFGVEDDDAEAVLRLEPVDQLVQRRTPRLDGAALHGSGAVDHGHEGIPRSVGRALGHRRGPRDLRGHSRDQEEPLMSSGSGHVH